MSRTIYDKRTLISRVKAIRSQIEKIEEALIDETDCSSILKDVSEICNSINSSFNEVIYPKDDDKLKALFMELINWDRNIHDIVEKTANWLENISGEVFDLVEAGKLEEANKLISDSRKALFLINNELKQTTMSCFLSTHDIQLRGISNKGSNMN